MGLERIQEQFEACRARGAGGFLPYITAGFPDLEMTSSLIRRADALGANVIEIGFPFSDSIADGPVIQESFHAALSQGIRVDDVFSMIREVRPDISAGLVAMVSASIVERFPFDRFMDRLVESGLDGVIVPDLPIEESDRLRRAAKERAIACIGLVAPTTPPDRADRIASGTTGFVYHIAVAGTTGERDDLPSGFIDHVQRLRRHSRLPVCVGFGVSTAEHVALVCRHADGAIIGSAIVRRIRSAVDRGATREAVIDETAAFLAELQRGTKPADRARL